MSGRGRAGPDTTGQETTGQDIAETHKGAKKDSYWASLTGGTTAAYKEQVLDALIKAHRPDQVESLLDIGCGTCEFIFRYQREFPGARAACMDHDPKVIAGLKTRYPDAPVDWLVADAFALGQGQLGFDLVFLLDVVHEIYSFYGRSSRQPGESVDHALGLAAVERLLGSVGAAVRPGGLILITDNVLCEEQGPVRVRLKNPAAADAARHFLAHFPTRRMAHAFTARDELTLGARDFCILLTQYNKIKAADWDRWNVEKMEIHQYYTLAEYGQVFDRLGFDLHAQVGTPQEARREWDEDFEVLDGLADIPPKRITLAAKKRECA